jgi:hypothetical protein
MAAAFEQSFIREVIDLPLKCTDTPVLADRFPDVIVPGSRILHPHQEPVM